jgi:hypothetical protein
MPRFYQYAGSPRQYNAAGRMFPGSARAAESRDLGSLGAHGAMGSLGDHGAMGSLGKIQQSSNFGGQEGLNGAQPSNFGGQDKGLGAMMLSNNEKTLVAVAAIGLVGWFVFGKQIKKSFKGNPPKIIKGSNADFLRSIRVANRTKLRRMRGAYSGITVKKGASSETRGRARNALALINKELSNRRAKKRAGRQR